MPKLTLDTKFEVFFYEQEFYPLSNFSSFTLQWDGFRFDTSEAAYHYEKFPRHPDLRKRIREAPSAHEALNLAASSKHLQRRNWEKVRLDVMRDILRAKAEQHEYVRRKLLETGERYLCENSWRDAFWGWGENRRGQNWLGKLWMEIRSELLAQSLIGKEGV